MTAKHDLAIIGMAGRFPGARSVDEFWRNLVGGVESIRRLSPDELLRAGVPRREFESPEYVPACPVLDDVDKFDAAFFGMSPRDASVMDPAHRLFLEVAWQALEDSGNTGLPGEGRVGVFASSGAPLYWMNNVRSHREIAQAMGEFLVRHTGNDMNFLATRASYDLDLRGPSINVQTACSSGLVAVHLARQSLLARECDMALIGGATVVLPMAHGYHWKEGEILSPDGHCRPFDHRSAGTVFGSGAACVVLKRLEDALDHGDHVVAVVKGSAVNNDGAVKVGYLAPGVDGQVEVIRAALQNAGVAARDISYVEAHGTGTSVGDPIELTALEQAFAVETKDKQFCGIGSVKSNIGHLGEAAGVASLIKVALALKHRRLPPTLGYERPNPRFAMSDSPFHVVAQLQEWRSPGPLRAGITALGAGGTNCHLVLEEAPTALPGEGGRDRHLLVLSARTKTALDAMARNLAAHLEQNPGCDLGDVAYTLAMGRRPLSHRRALVVREHADAIRLLRGEDSPRVGTVLADANDPGVVFLFPGGGAQYARMGFDLHQREPAFRNALEQCLAIVDRECGPQVRKLLLAPAAEAEAATKQLERPSLTLPALFAVEYALAKLFESYGLKPVAYVGHSMGEYVAACLAGVFSLRDGLGLVQLRGRLFERTPPGRMIAVPLAEAAALASMPAGLSIAAVNAPDLCVASGPRDLIESFGAALTAKGVDWTPIHIDVAAHSTLLEPILGEFRTFCRSIAFHAPSLPLASNLTGRWLTPAEAQDPEYWVRHLRSTVRFADCVETVLAGGSRVFVEIGPGRTLTTLVGAQKTKVRNAVNSVRHPREAADDVEYALLTLGKAWAAGAGVDWTALYDGQLRNRVPLPVYPFEGQSYWIEARARANDDASEPAKRENVDDWFATVAWQQAPLVPATKPVAKHCLVLANEPAAGAAIAAAIHRVGDAHCEVVLAQHGDRFRQLDAARFALDIAAVEQHRELFEALKREGRAPEHVVLVLGGGATAPRGRWRKAAGRTPLRDHFLVPAHVCQAMAATLDAAMLTIVTHNAFSVAGEPLAPLARLAAGPALVMSRELPDLPARLVDLDASDASARAVAARAEQLAREVLSGDAAPIVALRAPRRWMPQLRPAAMPNAPEAPAWLADGDVVFLTGGLGGIGRALAQHFAARRRVRLALLSRETLPPRDAWAAALARGDAKVAERIRWVQQLEQRGAQVLVVQGDVAERASLQSALGVVRARFGAIGVVIHAAGVMDDEPLLAKTDAKMLRVLAPKVQGTQNLDELITEPVKAFVLMSSIASFLGLPGQIDYTAANAFLDAFAEDRQRRRAGRTIVVNWNAWRDVGMVLGIGRGGALPPLPAGRTSHPWLAAWEPTPAGRRYQTDFAIDTQWLVAEHRIEGADALIPGTGFVELARAAFADAVPAGADGDGIELSQVTFLAPFQVAATAPRRLQIDVAVRGSTAAIVMRSVDGGETHLTAEAKRCHGGSGAISFSAMRARCGRCVATRDRFLDQDFVRFGPRWQNIDEIAVGDGEAVLSLALDEAFAADLGALAFHPALLDMATGAAQCLIPGFAPREHFLVPFGYDRIRILAPVTRRCISHVRLRPGSTTDVASFDVRVFDEAGQERIAIDGFTMKRVDRRAGIVHKAPAATPSAAKANDAVAALLREAIGTDEGLSAFDRILAQQELVQVVASSVDVEVWRRKLAREAKPGGGDAGEGGTSFARPALSSDFVEPAAGVETQVAAIWSKLLGVAQVGATDDFFELGGSSLVTVRFFARIKKDFGLAMPLSTLFQAPTIRTFCNAMREQGYVDATTAGVAAAASVAAAAAKAGSPAPPLLIRPGSGKLPVFFVHDGLGEVLLYRSLALLLDGGHAIYGLEPETANGGFVHLRITDMARAKVERMRNVQPHGPYLLSGLCAGGVIAFEIARQLQDLGERTLFVGIIDAADVGAATRDYHASQRWSRVRELFRPVPGLSRLQHWLGVVPALAKKGWNLAAYAVRSQLERARTKRTVVHLRDLASGAAQAPPSLGFLKLYENAHREHAPHGVFTGGHVVLFRATQGNGNLDDVPFREFYTDALLGWQCRVAEPVRAVDVPGGHSSALQEPHVRALARELQSCIDAALANATPASAPTEVRARASTA